MKYTEEILLTHEDGEEILILIFSHPIKIMKIGVGGGYLGLEMIIKDFECEEEARAYIKDELKFNEKELEKSKEEWEKEND